MTGRVRRREPRVKLRLRGPTGQSAVVEVVVDTGFAGALTLPRTQIAALGLRRRGASIAMLADGSLVSFDVFEATVIWHRRARKIIVDQSDATPLLGMAMMENCELNIDVRPGGVVRIRQN